MANISERGITNRQAAEKLFKQGNVTLPAKGGDIFISSRVVEDSRFPFRITGEQERNGQMVEVFGGSGVSQADALSAVPYRFRSGLAEIFKENQPE